MDGTTEAVLARRILSILCFFIGCKYCMYCATPPIIFAVDCDSLLITGATRAQRKMTEGIAKCDPYDIDTHIILQSYNLSKRYISPVQTFCTSIQSCCADVFIYSLIEVENIRGFPRYFG